MGWFSRKETPRNSYSTNLKERFVLQCMAETGLSRNACETVYEITGATGFGRTEEALRMLDDLESQMVHPGDIHGFTQFSMVCGMLVQCGLFTSESCKERAQLAIRSLIPKE